MNRTREEREQGMEKHRDCCGWRPPEERCGATTKGMGAICTRDADHDDYHYDAVYCLRWAKEGGR